ncbi:hemin uptake protein HemP [Luteimonas sp. MJ246]|uniref:hemin uptake protein HemP n=1 Tax=Luteimonas sp. MJ174 TaxID=3129237 RepID=UPI0031BB4B38
MLASRTHPSSFDSDTDASSCETPQVPGAHHDEVDSIALLHGRREVLIRHGSELYRLRHTRNDKLILTK